MWDRDSTLAPCLVCGAMVRVTDAEALDRHAAWHVKHGDIEEASPESMPKDKSDE